MPEMRIAGVERQSVLKSEGCNPEIVLRNRRPTFPQSRKNSPIVKRGRRVHWQHKNALRVEKLRQPSFVGRGRSPRQKTSPYLSQHDYGHEQPFC